MQDKSTNGGGLIEALEFIEAWRPRRIYGIINKALWDRGTAVPVETISAKVADLDALFVQSVSNLVDAVEKRARTEALEMARATLMLGEGMTDPQVRGSDR